MKICRNCDNARQVGDLTRTDIVGCAAFMNEVLRTADIQNEGKIYQGYAYPKRRPGDVAPSKPHEIGRGAIIYTTLLTDTLTCHEFIPIDHSTFPIVTSD